jgi:hypothetical protein
MKMIKGGDILASGGFGCVFKPALKCKNSTRDIGDNTVSKLMTTKHATDEYNQIQAFKKVLEHIPNYKKYFLVDDFSLCQPQELEREDLQLFDKKCKALVKKKFTRTNINQSLEKVLAINMPDGGLDIKGFLKRIREQNKKTNNNHKNSQINTEYVELNKSLIDLLINGIIPMNKLNLYHCDVKNGNILVKKSNGLECRLIDWGLSVHHTNKNGIPHRLYRRPFQYNVPFSVILFNKEFTKRYAEFMITLDKENKQLDMIYLKEFVTNYIFAWNKIRGIGHLKIINSIIQKLTRHDLTEIKKEKIKKHVMEYNFTYGYIVDYISSILLKFTVDGEFKLLNYFNNVFLKTVDIWGFVMNYLIFLNDFGDYDDLNQTQLEFIDKIKYIVMHYLFESPTKVIDVNMLVKELQDLNSIIMQFDLINTKTNTNTNLGKGIIKSKKNRINNKSRKVCQNKKKNKTRNKRNKKNN